MAKLKRKKGLKDVTGDGKFTFADVLKMRGVKPKKSMGNGGRNDDPPSFSDKLSSNLSNAAEFLMAGPATAAYRAYKASPDAVKEGVHTALGGPLAYVYRRYMDGQASEAAESARPDQDPYGFVGPVMPGEDAMGPSRDEQPRDPRTIRREPIRVEPLEPRRAPKLSLPRNRQIIDPRADVRREINRNPFVMPDNLRGMGYGGKVKMMKGGKVEYGMGGKTMEYGLGGAVMGGINALMAGKGLGGAALAAGKGFATPGSGFAQGAKLAGNLAQKSNNPLLQNVGKMAGMASNFLPGGNPMGAIGALGGLFQAKGGMMVPPSMRLLRR